MAHTDDYTDANPRLQDRGGADSKKSLRSLHTALKDSVSILGTLLSDSFSTLPMDFP